LANELTEALESRVEEAVFAYPPGSPQRVNGMLTLEFAIERLQHRINQAKRSAH
jgi:hypothetical protein